MTSDAIVRVVLAALHLAALAIGLGGVLTRGAALREQVSADSVRRALRADVDWGVAAALWIGSGLWRYLAETEKISSYYDHSYAFLAKMTLLLVVLALEIWPMVTLIRWRVGLRRGRRIEEVVAPRTAARISAISRVQAGLVVTMVVLAVAVARFLGPTG